LNKKYEIASIVLLALMCGYIVPTSVKGFSSGNGVTPNTTWNEYGPNVATVWFHGYSNYASELAAIESKSIDFIDTTLVPSDYNTMIGLGGFNFTFVTQLAIDEIDWNNAFLPFNNTNYKQAVSDILQVDKANFVQTYLGIGGALAYSPIPGCIVANSGYNWYDPNTANIWTGGYSAALTLFENSGIPLTRDKITGGGTTYATWNFSAPFPVSGGNSYNPKSPYGTSATGWNLMGDGADNNLGAGTGGLFILTRTSDQRQYLGPEVQRMLGSNFTWWYQNKASAGDETAWQTALTNAGLPTNLLPIIEVTVKQITIQQASTPVWEHYCFEMYTAGYSYGMQPSSMLENYLDSNAPQNFNWGPYHDETCYINPTYDNLEAHMENSTTQGNAVTPGTGVYYCYAAQMALMSNPPLDPMWVWTDYSPTLASDYQCIPYGYVGGFESWWTFLNAYPTAGSPYYSTNALYAGLRSPIQNQLNPVSTSDFYDSQIIGEIYDTLAVANPYNLSQLVPYIATSWSTGTWANDGNGKTDSMYNVTMRNDVEWQDVPGPENRAKFTWNNGTELNGPLTDRFMTPLDVAFSYAYGALGYGFTAVYSYYATILIDHVTISSTYQVAWDGQIGHNATVDGTPWCNETYVENVLDISPSTLAWPFQQFTTLGETPYYTTDQYLTNFVRFDPTLGPYQIKIYLSELQPWLGLYPALGTLILPMDIFSNLALGTWNYTLGNGHRWTTPDETVMDLEPWSYSSGADADLLYGSGPYIFVDDAAAVPAITFRLDAYRAGLTYGPGLTTHGAPTVTTDHSYFWIHAHGLPSASVCLNPSRISGVAGQIVNVTLEISNIVSLYEFWAGCTFNPLVVHCLNVSDGGFLESLGGTSLYFPGTINNTGGTVSPYCLELNGTAKAPSGSGPLLTFRFQIVATGYSDVHLIDWVPINKYYTQIPTKTLDYFTTSGKIVQITGNPEGFINATQTPPPYVGFNAQRVGAVSTSVNGTVYNGDMNFTIYSPYAAAIDNYGFFNVTIPKNLMACSAPNQWWVSLNGVVQSSRVVSENATHTTISLEFNYSATGLEEAIILSVYYWSTGQYESKISTTGTNVTVSPATCANVTFTNITKTGVLEMNVTQPTSNTTTLAAAPNSMFVSIKTNATYVGNVTLHFSYSPAGLTLQDQGAMKIWLWNTTSAEWVDITTSVDTVNHIVYGVSPHLSMFGITASLSLLNSNSGTVKTDVQYLYSLPGSYSALPDDLQAVVYFNMSTTPPYYPSYTIRAAYNSSLISPLEAQFMRMWLWNTTSSQWVDITEQVDTVGNVIYGVSPHLSMFGITRLASFPLGVVVASKGTCSKTVVGKGFNVYITVPLVNQGSSTQSFDALVYANYTLIGTVGISNLQPSGQTNMTFTYTAGLAYGNYSISVCDQPVSWLKITIPGDINGDGVVNLKDLGLITGHWMQKVPPAPANADILNVGVINLRDLGVVTGNWQKHA
jgi:hypothetical protein